MAEGLLGAGQTALRTWDLASILCISCVSSLRPLMVPRSLDGGTAIYIPIVSRASPSYAKSEKGSGGNGCTAVSPWNAIIGIFMCVN